MRKINIWSGRTAHGGTWMRPRVRASAQLRGRRVAPSHRERHHRRAAHRTQRPPLNSKVKRAADSASVPTMGKGVAFTSVNVPSATDTGTPSVRSICLDHPPPSTVALTISRPAWMHCTSAGQRLSSTTRSGRTLGPSTAAISPKPTGPSTGRLSTARGAAHAASRRPASMIVATRRRQSRFIFICTRTAVGGAGEPVSHSLLPSGSCFFRSGIAHRELHQRPLA